ncbi:MAG: rhmA [Planctomycetota bacterium]|nr:rhmA [Planctomycetota bacterium]
MIENGNELKRKLAAGKTTAGLWVTLESATITEIAVVLGYDWVVIDTEHGHLDLREVLDHVRAVRGASTTPIVRIQEIEQGTIKRVLDIGAAGIIVPQVTCAEDVERAVRFAKYPPRGIRGVGGERATRWGMGLREMTGVADQETMVIPLVETVAAGEAIDQILDVPGVDAIFFGPADYSASAGHLGEWEGPGVASRLLELKDRIVARGVPCGIMATDVENARMRAAQGFRMIGLGSDTGLLIRSSREALAALRGPEPGIEKDKS